LEQNLLRRKAPARQEDLVLDQLQTAEQRERESSEELQVGVGNDGTAPLTEIV
jgi:hypothetical protein